MTKLGGLEDKSNFNIACKIYKTQFSLLKRNSFDSNSDERKEIFPFANAFLKLFHFNSIVKPKLHLSQHN